MNELISVILPAYNVENYINNCITSVINQTYTNIEIIIVNDGSTDKTGEIIEKFSKKDTRIKVCNKNNGGIASARNIGLKCAKGEYICFIDTDDTIEKDMLEILYTSIKKNNADISIVRVAQCFENGRKEYFDFSYAKEQVVDLNQVNWLIKDASIVHPVWNKLYRKKIITFEFDEDIPRNEDIEFNGMFYGVAKKMVINNEIKYMQLQRMSSLTHKDRKIFEEVQTLERVKKKLYQFYQLNCPERNDFIKKYMDFRLDIFLTTVVPDSSSWVKKRQTLIYLRKNFPDWKYTLEHDIKSKKTNKSFKLWGMLYNKHFNVLLYQYTNLSKIKRLLSRKTNNKKTSMFK